MVNAELPVYDQTDQGIRMLEEERRRIARDLHDGPAQALTNISMQLDVLKRIVKANPGAADAKIDQLNSKVISTVNEVRHLIYDLRPIAIDEVGLSQAIEDLCTRCEKDWHVPLVVTFNGDIDFGKIAPAKQVSIYRLVQEILNNIKKHAKAKNISVGLSETDGSLCINIVDDGKGFDPSVIPAGHYGLIGMKERASYMGGVLDIHSEIGNGSQFSIKIPL